MNDSANNPLSRRLHDAKPGATGKVNAASRSDTMRVRASATRVDQRESLTQAWRKLRSNTTMFSLCIAVVCAMIVAGGIWWTSQVNTPRTSRSKAERTLDHALRDLNETPSADRHDPLSPRDPLQQSATQLVARFNSDHAAKQVTLDELRFNPFVLRAMARERIERTSAAQSMEAQRREHRRQMMNHLKQLRLQSVMQGARPMALINGTFYQPGQKVGPFVLDEIAERRVVLRHGGVAFMLEMQSAMP